MSIRAIAAGITLAVLPAVTGCGSLGPGDYLVFRVGVSDQKLSADCYDNAIPPSVAEDSTTFRSGATFILYIVEDETARLDAGGSVLEGSGDGDSFAFDGAATDVEPIGGGAITDCDHDGLDDFGADTFVDADMDGLDDQVDDPFVDTDGDGLDDRFEDPLVDANNDGVDDCNVELPADTKLVTKTSVDVELLVDGDLVSGNSTTKTSFSCSGPQCPPGFLAASCTSNTDFEGVVIEDGDVALSPGGGQP